MKFDLIFPDGRKVQLVEMQPVAEGQRCRLTIPAEPFGPGQFHDSGLLVLEDQATGLRYAGQLLRTDYDDNRCIMTCVPFGELAGPQADDQDEDLLVLGDGEVVPIHHWLYATSACARGPHFRIECDVDAWQCLPYGLGEAEPCGCEDCRAMHRRGNARYEFKPLRSMQGDTTKPPRVEVVRLRTRQRFLVDLEHALIHDDRMVIIGHVNAQVLWPTRALTNQRKSNPYNRQPACFNRRSGACDRPSNHPAQQAPSTSAEAE